MLKKKSQFVAKLRDAISPIERGISRTEDLISLKKKEMANQEKVIKRYIGEINHLNLTSIIRVSATSYEISASTQKYPQRIAQCIVNVIDKCTTTMKVWCYVAVY